MHLKEHIITNLTEALSPHFSKEEAINIAMMLYCGNRSDSILYADIDINPDIKDEMILLAYQERILLPVKSLRGSAWEDRVISFTENERYHLPRVVRFLTNRAEESGVWDCEYAVREVLEEAGNNDIEEALSFLKGIGEIARNQRIEVKDMQAMATSLGMNLDMHDTMDRFVRCGIMSPVTQRSLHAGFPMYELNPCLRWERR